MSYDRGMSDTTPDAARVQLEVYRRMTGAQRVELGVKLSMAMRRMVLEGIRARHPEYTDEQARLVLFRVLLGDELFRKAWPGERLLAP